MIPLVDLKAQYRSIKAEIDQALAQALENATFILGPDVAAFEQAFAAYCQAEHAVGVNSGTSALHLAMLAAGIGPGDEVITTPYTFVASVAAIRYTGATPVFVDITPDTYTLDPSRIEEAITGRTRAILPVHLYGHPADMDPILEIAGRHGLIVIEDAAQAHGAEYRNRRVGNLADFGIFSFYPGKNLGAYGEGGLVLSRSAEQHETIRLLRDWGQKHRYEYNLQGYNYRMEGLQGAILGVKLRYLEQWTEARRVNARLYSSLLTECGLGVPVEKSWARHVYNVYALRCPNRDAVQARLKAAGVQTAIHYPIPIHLQPAHADLGYRAGQFPVAEAIAREEISLPVYPELQVADIEFISGIIRETVASQS